MRFKALLSLLSLGLCALCANAQNDPLQITVDRMPDQPLPVQITSAHLQNFQYTSQLNADYDIEKGTAPVSIGFLLILYHDGKVLAGEGWEETPQHGSIFLRDMKVALRPGDRAILIVDHVKSDSRTWKLNDKELMEQMHAYIEGKQTQSVPVEVSLRMQSRPKLVLTEDSQSACDADLNAAIAACGRGNLGSFSCDPSTGKHQFSCKGSNAPTQPPPGPSIAPTN